MAALLAKKGKRVLVVDWDLEAPGIEKYFEKPERETPSRLKAKSRLIGSRANTPGMLDLILAHRRGEPLDWHKCLLTARPFGEDEDVTLSIISAGEASASYERSVQGLDWEDLFTKHNLTSYLDQLRNQWAQKFDFVLIDSRTGINDIGNICTIILPDVLVLFFTTTEPSLDGVKTVMERVRPSCGPSRG